MWPGSDCYHRCSAAFLHSYRDRISASDFHSTAHANCHHNNTAANGDPHPIDGVDRRSDPDEHGHGHTRADRDSNVPSFSDGDLYVDPYTNPGAHRHLHTRQAGGLCREGRGG